MSTCMHYFVKTISITILTHNICFYKNTSLNYYSSKNIQFPLDIKTHIINC